MSVSLGGSWQLISGRPVAMQAAAQADTESGGRHRPRIDVLGIENEQIRQAFHQAIDNRYDITLALARAAGFGDETGLLEGRSGARPQGLCPTGLVIEVGQRVD